jgi:hypothetical protein
VKISRRVDIALGWVERYGLALVVALVLAVVAALLRWQPVLAALVLGSALGGLPVQLWMSGRVRKTRREMDEVLRQNGALRHRNILLSSGVMARDAQPTQVLIAIPETAVPVRDPQDTRPLEARSDLPDGPGEQGESSNDPLTLGEKHIGTGADAGGGRALTRDAERGPGAQVPRELYGAAPAPGAAGGRGRDPAAGRRARPGARFRPGADDPLVPSVRTGTECRWVRTPVGDREPENIDEFGHHSGGRSGCGSGEHADQGKGHPGG